MILVCELFYTLRLGITRAGSGLLSACNLFYRIILLSCCVAVVSCGSNEKAVLRKQLSDFMTETVVVPLHLHKVEPSVGVSLLKEIPQVPKLIVYYDSSSCNDCEVAHLSNLEWLYHKSAKEKTFEVFTIFAPLPEEYDMLLRLLEASEFHYPIYIDPDGLFEKANSFIPDDVRFHSFLIDGTGRIVYVGNPSQSEQLRKSFETALMSCRNVQFPHVFDPLCPSVRRTMPFRKPVDGLALLDACRNGTYVSVLPPLKSARKLKGF